MVWCRRRVLLTSWTWRSADFEERCIPCAACHPRVHGTHAQRLTDSSLAPPYTASHATGFQLYVILMQISKKFICNTNIKVPPVFCLWTQTSGTLNCSTNLLYGMTVERAQCLFSCCLQRSPCLFISNSGVCYHLIKTILLNVTDTADDLRAS